MAFFSDEEEFANNQLVAGELDLKIDWEEHYSDWKGEETGFARMPEPGEDPDYLLPAFNLAGSEGEFITPDDVAGQVGPLANGVEMAPMDGRPIELVFTQGEDAAEGQDLFWDATAIDAYPDDDNDGSQDLPEGFDFCESNADLPGALDSDLRTEGSRGDPLISLDDVKPGDFGEVTFSFHLCDNPGYVWLTGGLVDADENGNTEPEAEDEDEYGPGEGPDDDLFDNEGDESDEPSTDPEDTEQERVELLDYVLTRIWRDDGAGSEADAGNNQVDEITGQLDVVCAIDTSGSLTGDEPSNLADGVNQFITALAGAPADANVGTLEFGGGAVTITNNLQPAGDFGSIGTPSTGGNTPMPGAIEIADQQVRNDPNARAGAEKIVVLFTDGGPNYSPTATYNANGYSAGPFDQGTTDSTVTEGEMTQTASVATGVKSGTTRIATVYVGDEGQDTQAMSASAISTYTDLPTYLASSGPIATSPTDAFDVALGNLSDLSDQLVTLVTAAEKVLFLGTLRDALEAVSGSPGLELDGDIPAEEGGGTGDQGCFEPSTTQYIGFEWWLPINHGNQVQGDSVQFDLGFYTEQCRHNDGSGQVGNNAT
jgi:hypothetical protein